jgi:hypothetical protein
MIAPDDRITVSLTYVAPAITAPEGHLAEAAVIPVLPVFALPMGAIDAYAINEFLIG